MGALWFGVEAEGGQDLAGLSLFSLKWVKCMCSRPNPEQRSDSLLASEMSWAKNFVDFSGNPVLHPKPRKREERQE